MFTLESQITILHITATLYFTSVQLKDVAQDVYAPENGYVVSLSSLTAVKVHQNIVLSYENKYNICFRPPNFGYSA